MAHFICLVLCNIRADRADMHLLWFLTLLKQDSHSVASSVCRSWTRSALWRYVRACIRTCRLASQHSQAMPEMANDNHTWAPSQQHNPRFLHSNYGSPCLILVQVHTVSTVWWKETEKKLQENACGNLQTTSFEFLSVSLSMYFVWLNHLQIF